MPFDRDSFLNGVITGMRLPRTPGGQRPNPPVPGGYILTESGIAVVMEGLEPPTDVSIYAFDRWYDATLYSDGYPFSPVRESGIEYEVQQVGGLSAVYYFYWVGYYLDDALSLVVVSENDLTNFNIVGNRRDDDESPIEFVFSGRVYIPSRAEDFYYYTFGRAACTCRPDGMTYFDGTAAELKAFISGIKHHRLITEGG